MSSHVGMFSRVYLCVLEPPEGANQYRLSVFIRIQNLESGLCWVSSNFSDFHMKNRIAPMKFT